MRRSIATVVAVVMTTLITPAVCAGVVLATSIFLPLPAELPQANPGIDSRITHVYDVNGAEIATFREFETSKPVDAALIPQVLKDAVVSAEDKSFYSHGGVDVRGTLRALWADIRDRGLVQGGSTITQQYVKNAYTGGERTVARKIREAILASQLDRQVSKDEILFRYLSTIYFGEGAYGVGAAAETYFRKEVQNLTLSEAALLAGVIPAPSRYSPRVDPARAEQKRQFVLEQMLSEGYITPEQHAVAAAEVVYLDVAVPPPGPVTVVWPPLPQQTSAPWFTDYLARWLEARLTGGHDQLYRGGLHIYTTFDPAAQAAAEDAMHRAMDGADPDLQMALVAVEPPTGYVRAIVGGRDFNVSQVNNALGSGGGGTGRQPGSSFKPFVLATAFEQGVSPTKRYSGDVLQVGDDVIENYGGSRYGVLDLRTAMWKSVNTVYARLILDVGVDRTMDVASRLGLGLPAFDPAVYGASVALGALEVAPIEMASAFGVFANGGRRAEPTPVVQVYGPDGQELLLDRSHAVEEAQPVIPEVVADNVTDVLRGVLDSGTAAGKGLDRPAAGKTGTSSDNADAWFVGFTPTLSTAVWIGHESGRIELRNVLGVRGGMTGGAVPATTWQRFMRAALANVPATDFNEPAPIRDIADQAKREARQGFDPGARRSPAGTPSGGPYVYGLEGPTVDAPTTTTTLPPPTTSTTVRPPVTPSTRPPLIN